MTLAGVHIRKRLGRLSTLSRVRHYRGHGVHSPFVYALVRNVFMKRREVVGEQTALFRELLARRTVNRRRAVQLQNLYNYCGYTGYSFVGVAGIHPLRDGEIAVLTVACTAIERMVDEVGESRGVVCVIAPRDSDERLKACRRVVERHTGTSIDNRGYLLLFFNDRLPKQHFKL